MAVHVHYMYCPGPHDSLLSHLLIPRTLLCQLMKLLLSICISQLAVVNLLSMTSRPSRSKAVCPSGLRQEEILTPAEAVTKTAETEDVTSMLC